MTILCPHCGAGMSATNTKQGIKYQAFNQKNLSDKFLDLVLANIPPKPWPQGMHKMVAEKMGLSRPR